jgi:hypothetical protein
VPTYVKHYCSLIFLGQVVGPQKEGRAKNTAEHEEANKMSLCAEFKTVVKQFCTHSSSIETGLANLPFLFRLIREPAAMYMMHVYKAAAS